MMKLGRLQKLNLREYWKREDTEFTPWLAKQENIELLSEAIGIELEVVGQERSVGPFSADILCKDTLDNHFVLIENQLERTDHTHLGQLITYASGLDAVTIIWIAQNFTEEHRAALDWLNRITDDTFTFFGIEIELYKIGESLPAPMFNIVSKPNDWSKQIKKGASSENVTETKQLQQDYWQALKEYAEAKGTFLRFQQPSPQHWTNLAIGKSNYSLSANVNSRENNISIWLNIVGPDAKENFDKLKSITEEAAKAAIHQDLGWHRMEEKKQSAVGLKHKANFSDKKDWPNQFDWFIEHLEKFTTHFKPIIAKL